MKIKLIFILFFGISALSAQEIADSVYWVYFTDKNNNGFEISQPEAFLSERSIERRAWQGLAIDHTDEPVNQNYVDSIRSMGIEVRHVSRWLNGFVMVDVSQDQYDQVLEISFTSTTPWEAETDEVYFPPEPTGERFEPPLPASPEFTYGVATEQIELMSMDLLHDLGYTGMGVWIAVLDAGFRNVDSLPSFEKLIDEGRLLETRNFVNKNSVFRQENTHGMYVLSIMAAEWDGNMIGAAPHASYILCMTENPVQETRIEEIAWTEAAEYIDSLGFDVINTSLGYSLFDGDKYDYTYADMDGKSTFISRAASMCAAKGIIACNSAGNSGNDDWYYITAPADAFDILGVGALDSDKLIADFSSRGPSYDARVKPDVSAMGVGTGIQSINGGLARGGGTSFASPLIAGSVASLWQAFPTLSASEMIHKVRQSGDRNRNPDSTYGFGVPDFAQAYWRLTSIPAAFIQGDMEVYPIPASDRIQIRIPEVEGSYQVSLFSMDGRKIQSGLTGLPGTFLLPATLESGIYLLVVQTPGTIYRSRLIKE